MQALLKALTAARKEMPALERSEHGEDFHGKPFAYPSEADLQAAVELVFAANDLLDVPGEAVFANANLTLSWTLYHVSSGEHMVLKLAWPVFERDSGYLSRAHACAATWSHAWRHLMVKLLRPQILAAGDSPRRATREPAVVGSVELDRDLGPAPEWASAPPVDAPWRALERAEKERTAVHPEAQWVAAGAVVETITPPREPPPVYDLQSTFDVWAEFCARVPLRRRRWASVLSAWHEFSERLRDVLVPEDPAFKAWLRCQDAETA